MTKSLYRRLNKIDKYDKYDVSVVIVMNNIITSGMYKGKSISDLNEVNNINIIHIIEDKNE